MAITTESPYVWICDPYHQHYPNYVKVLEVLPDKYIAQVQLSVGYSFEEGPIEEFKKEQLSDDLIGG